MIIHYIVVPMSISTTAMRLLTEALRIDRNNVRIYVAKASMEMRANNFSEARATLKRATELSSESDGGQHYTMWATLEIEAGNFREARRLLEEGAAKYPGDQVIFLVDTYCSCVFMFWLVHLVNVHPSIQPYQYSQRTVLCQYVLFMCLFVCLYIWSMYVIHPTIQSYHIPI